MVNQRFEIYIDSKKSRLSFDLQTQDQIQLVDPVSLKETKFTRKFISFEISRDDLYSFQLRSLSLTKTSHDATHQGKPQSAGGVPSTGKSYVQLTELDNTFVLSLSDKFIFLKPKVYDAILKKLCEIWMSEMQTSFSQIYDKLCVQENEENRIPESSFEFSLADNLAQEFNSKYQLGFNAEYKPSEEISFPYLLTRCNSNSKNFCLSFRRSSGDFNTLGIVFLLRRVVRIDNSLGMIHISMNVERTESILPSLTTYLVKYYFSSVLKIQQPKNVDSIILARVALIVGMLVVLTKMVGLCKKYTLYE